MNDDVPILFINLTKWHLMIMDESNLDEKWKYNENSTGTSWNLQLID